MIDQTAIRARYLAIKDQLDERGRRLFVAAEKVAAGYGRTAAVSRATGVAHSTIIRGTKDRLTAPAAPDRVRRKGAGRPVISVDTRKKELIGEYRNAGSDYRAAGCPDAVNVDDFVDKTLGKVAPYGIYDVATNTGCVNLGIDHDTAAFAVNAVRRRHQVVGSVRYPKAGRMPITADGGGSNGSRVRLWKRELQKPADETGLTFQVCHYPPGTGKWNKIEHRMFRHITQMWRNMRLVSRVAVVNLIAATTTKTGLAVSCELDGKSHAKGIKVADAEMARLHIETDPWHPEENYTIKT